MTGMEGGASVRSAGFGVRSLAGGAHTSICTLETSPNTRGQRTKERNAMRRLVLSRMLTKELVKTH